MIRPFGITQDACFTKSTRTENPNDTQSTTRKMSTRFFPMFDITRRCKGVVAFSSQLMPSNYAIFCRAKTIRLSSKVLIRLCEVDHGGSDETEESHANTSSGGGTSWLRRGSRLGAGATGAGTGTRRRARAGRGRVGALSRTSRGGRVARSLVWGSSGALGAGSSGG